MYSPWLYSCLFQGEADITLIMPHCLSRSSALYREAVVKAKINNTWVYLGTEETNVDEYKVGYKDQGVFQLDN